MILIQMLKPVRAPESVATWATPQLGRVRDRRGCTAGIPVLHQGQLIPGGPWKVGRARIPQRRPLVKASLFSAGSLWTSADAFSPGPSHPTGLSSFSRLVTVLPEQWSPHTHAHTRTCSHTHTHTHTLQHDAPGA